MIDRFVDSTIAYQHYGFGLNLSIIELLNRYLLKNFKIDFTFLNIVNKTNMKRRLRMRKSLNRYDKFEYKFYNKVQNGFLKIAKKNKRKYMIVNSNLDIERNYDQVIQKIEKII